jgi:hypothetical protein
MADQELPRMALQPSPEFNWLCVSWEGPTETPSRKCSYCEKPIGRDEPRLCMFNAEGWAARFCKTCERTYWGLGT